LELKIQARVLLIGSVILVFVGFILWWFVGPAVILMGIKRLSTKDLMDLAMNTGMLGSISLAELSSTYWIGFTISIIGSCILAAGVIGVILTLVLKYSPNARKEPQARAWLIVGVILVFVGLMLWMDVGPTVIFMGIKEEKGVVSVMGSPPSLAEISSTYWLGFAISIIGLCILVSGVIGVILTFVLKYSRTYQKKESGLG
jgi:heme/copper-type cytochrome/quinol oxidase subunit 2